MVKRYAVFTLLAILAAGPTRAEEESAPQEIVWKRALQDAFEAAKEQDKPLMICINAQRVDGRARFEPAAKELRENTYRDPRIVALAQKFVCAFLTGAGTSDDYGELRLRYGIDGDIVSPQHIFAYPDGRLIDRLEYWPHGTGDGSVKALEGLMNKALAKDQARRGAGETTPGPGEQDDPPDMAGPSIRAAPESGPEREAWIREQMGLAQSQDPVVRRSALHALMEADAEGDIVTLLLALLAESKKRTDLQVDIVRAFGRPGLESVREVVEDFLDHKEVPLRANAAVSLEYIGSPESVSPLLKRAAREKEPGVANHIFRAAGRCGVGDTKVRKALVKHAQGGKTDFATYGPIIGLAYFEKDAKTAREVEKLIKKEGAPGGGRGGWRSGGKRALLTWVLTWNGFEDEKSAAFLREDMIPLIGESRWSGRIIDFFDAAARCCEGDAGARDEVEGGVVFSLAGWGGGRGGGGGAGGGQTPERPKLQDDAREGREDVGFHPRGEFAGT